MGRRGGGLRDGAQSAVSVLLAVVLHVLVIAAVVLTFETTITPAVEGGAGEPEIVHATVVDDQRLQDEMKRLADAEERKLDEERKRQQALEDAAQKAEQRREQEEQRLKELEQKRVEERQQQEAQRAQATAERERLEAERKAEEQRLVEVRQQKELAEKRRLEEEKKAAEAKRKADAERDKLEAERKAAEEKKRKEAAEEKKRKEEAERKAAEEKKAKQEAERKAAEEKKRKEEAERKAAEEKKRQAEADAARKALADALEREARGRAAQSELERYVGLIAAHVERAWLMPIGSVGGLSATLAIRLQPDGEVIDVRVARSSGDPNFDTSAVAAVRTASPLPMSSDPEVRERLRSFNFVFKPGG